MKKLIYLFTVIVMGAAIVSCDKETKMEYDTYLKDAVVASTSLPVSIPGNITPVILAVDKPRGGNVTCADVSQAIPASFDLCSDKLDYVNNEFNGDFPEWLDVTVTNGTYVSFSINNSGGTCYKVGAVIVKGSNASNVYYYPGGALSDGGLASPINRSGFPAGLSNLTFCFVECEEELVIAIKSLYYDGSGYRYAVSSGTQAFFIMNEWCGSYLLGYNSYPRTAPFDMKDGLTQTDVGDVTFVNGDITITLNEGLFLVRSYVYIGTLEDLQTTNLSTDSPGCPQYTNTPPWIKNVIYGNSQTFDL